MVLEGSERWLWGVGVWNVIRKEWDLVKGKVRFSISNGRRVKFWKGRWYGDSFLEESFLLFSFAIDKGSWVADVWE